MTLHCVFYSDEKFHWQNTTRASYVCPGRNQLFVDPITMNKLFRIRAGQGAVQLIRSQSTQVWHDAHHTVCRNSRCCCITKHHQRSDEICSIFTSTSSRKSAKLFSIEFCHAIYRKRPWHFMQCSSHCIQRLCMSAVIIYTCKYISALQRDFYHQTTFLISHIIVQVKFSRFHPVVGRISLQQHLLL